MFKKPSRNDEQIQLTEYFSKRTKDHWKKKIPKSKQYFYTVHDPYEIFGENSGYEKFYLVGDNWTQATDKPIAIAIGFNDWKFGFIADYLPEFRVAFAPRKLNDFRMISPLRKLAIKPSFAVIWGYNESNWLNRYLKFSKIKIWRAEDGFIRSADLGANGATPYSLVFDKSGLYYNPKKTSDIEQILNTYNFAKDIELKTHAESVLELIIKLKISKYNPPNIYRDTSLKLKKRILVIGQVDNDASIRYGNPEGWTMEDMVRLAKYENPNSEVLYRPHPEIYKGFQESKFKSINVQYFAKVISPDEHIIDIIERVDQVYTITSLTGLEALLRGKKVTVLGKPFYAGWGLTDDRSVFKPENRMRKLELWELFAASYLIYPRYLNASNKELSAIVSKTEILSILGKINSEKIEIINNLVKNGDIKTNVSQIELSNSLYNRNLNSLNYQNLSKILQKNGDFFQEVILFMLISIAVDDKARAAVLLKVRDIISPAVFNKILFITNSFYPGVYLNDQWIWLLTESLDYDAAKEQINLSGELTNLSSNKVVKDSNFYENTYIVSMASRDFALAKESLSSLIMTGDFDIKSIFRKCINTCSLSFDFQSAKVFSVLLASIDVFYANRVGVLENFRASIHSESDPESILKLCFDLAVYKPDKVFYTNFLLSNLHNVSQERIIKEALIKSFKLDNEISARKVNGLIAAELFQEAENVARKMILLNDFNASDSDIVVYSQALSFNNKVEKAITIIEKYIQSKGLSKVTATEAMRLYVLNSEYFKSLNILNRALSLRIDIGEMHRRKAYFGNRLVSEAFETFKHLNISTLLKIYFKDKYLNDLELLENKSSIFFLSIFGPGDEIRFASIYNQIKNELPNSEIFISCSPRLENLLRNSFQNINFISVERPRNDDKILIENYTAVPGADISGIIDNKAMQVIDRVNSITLVTSMLSDILLSYDSFLGSGYLICDKSIKDVLELKLPKNILLVGLSWRSSITTSARNEHYLTIAELQPLFEIDNIQFVNFQYDDSVEEVDWVNRNYPGKLLDFEDIDQYNDFDSVAALMSCMDLIIAPATTVAELSGALGVQTWLFSNSSELDWRKTNEFGTDVWHNSIEIVDLPNKGNKKDLVKEIYEKLIRFVDN